MLTILNELLSLKPYDQKIEKLLQNTEDKVLKAQECVRKGDLYFAESNYPTAVRLYSDAQWYASDLPDLENKLNTAEQAIGAIPAKLKRAKKLAAEGDIQTAFSLVEEILKVDQSHSAAQSLHTELGYHVAGQIYEGKRNDRLAVIIGVVGGGILLLFWLIIYLCWK